MLDGPKRNFWNQNDNIYLGYRIPFKWGVHFDDGEIAVTCAAIALNTCEQGMAAAGTGVPNGMIGFSMLYWQVLYCIVSVHAVLCCMMYWNVLYCTVLYQSC